MLLRTFRRWSPVVAHLALLLVLNLLLEGPAWAEQARLRPRLVKLPESLLSQGQEPLERAVEETLQVLEGLEAQAPGRELQGQGGEPQKTSRPEETPRIRRSYAAPKAPLVLASVALSIENQAVVPPLPSLPDMPAASSAPAAPQPATATAPSSTEAVSLLSGWNLISLPRQPDSIDPAAVFASISGSYQVAHVYDACSADPWRTYDPANPVGSSLTAIDHRVGLWVRATAAATLAVSGTEPAETTIQLCQGWNLIGYPLSQPRPVLAALSSIAGRFQRVYGWDPADPADPWEVFDVAVPAWANDLELMQPGRGYWIYATADTTLVMSNAGLPPEVEITSPADAATVTAPTDVVGTVKSDLLEQWTLAYRLRGETGAFTAFASGNTPVTNGMLGKFDPTLLLNGLYEIELTATDFQGQSVSTSIDVAVEGNLKIGHFTLSFVDLEVPLAGLPIQVIRNYDSRDRRVGDFGVSWTLELRNVRLQEKGASGDDWRGARSSGSFPTYCVFPNEAHLVTITLPDDTVLQFQPKVSPECQPLSPPQVVTIRYDPLPGTQGTLTALDQSEQALVVGSFPGPVQLWNQETTNLHDPSRYRLTLKDGRSLVIDQNAGLLELTDFNGNTLAFSNAGIRHSNGEGVIFDRDSRGRIIRITDPQGASLTYAYDTRGDLTAVADREEATTRFIYDDQHHLLMYDDPLGRRPIRNDYDAAGRLVRHIDAFGKTIEYGHRPGDRQEIITDRLGHSRLLEYDARGNVIREIDANGKETRRTFDARDNLLTEADPLGNTTAYTYDANENLTSLTDPVGNRTTFTYDDRGRVLTMTDPRGKVTSNAYDAKGNLTSTSDPLGNVTSYTYDTRGKLLTETNAEGNITRYTYDAVGNRIREIDPLGHETTYTYDQNGNILTRVTTRTAPGGALETLAWRFTYDRKNRQIMATDPDGSSIRTSYDPLGNVTEVIDKLGRRTTYSHDALGRLTTTTYPDGTTEQIAYDAEGRRASLADRSGRVTRFEYDAVGRLVRTVFPDGADSSAVYDASGRLIAVSDARGNTTTYEYDAAGHKTNIRNALGLEVSFAFDANGNQTSFTDAATQTTTFHYDDGNRLVRTVSPDHTEQKIEYDRLGLIVSETDPAGGKIRFVYDALGRLTSISDALEQITLYTYDELGNRLSQTDAQAHTTLIEYDPLGRMTRRTLADGSSELLSYDVGGRLIRRTDFNGNMVNYDYDLAGRLIRRSYPDATAVTFTYTPTGRRASVTDSRGTTFYEYDLRDRLTRFVDPVGRTLTYTYDKQGNRISLSTTHGGQVLTTKLTYDALNRLETVSDPQNRLYSHTYDPNGNRASLTYPNGVSTSYVYDLRNRLTALSTWPVAGEVLQSYAYTLRPAGHRARTEEHDGTVRTYGYDPLDQLTRETVTLASSMTSEDLFNYSPVGNRLTRTRTAGSMSSTSTYSYDLNDRLLAAGDTAFAWDANGNLLSQTGADGAVFGWSFDNRLTRITTDEGTVITHSYDADGNRVRTEITPPTGPPTVTEYLVDPSGALSQVVAEFNGQGNLQAYYVRGDDLLAVIRPAETRFYHADGQGSIRLLTDEVGAVTDRYSYSAFGELLAHSGSDSNPYLFAGEPWEPESGFYYLRARWLAPEWGRFASSDPFPAASSEPRGLHRYLYAWNDPVNLNDPTGLQVGGAAELSVTTSIQSIISEIQADLGFLLIEGALNGGTISLSSLLIGPVTGGALLVAGAVVRVAARSMRNVGRIRNYLEEFRTLGVQRIFKNKYGELTDEARQLVWKLNPFRRGDAIEIHLAATEYKQWFHIGAEHGGSYPLIDFQRGSEVVSLKTVGASDISSAIGWLKSHIDDLASARITVDDIPVASRILDIRVPPGGSSQLSSLVSFGQLQNVIVKIVEFP